MAVKETKLELSVGDSNNHSVRASVKAWLTESPSDGTNIASENASAEVDKKSKALVYLTILAIGIFYFATIRSGHDWGDDFSLYIQHAKNIAQGNNYWATSYLHLPPYVGPDAYPPGYPLLLAPIYMLFGMSLTAMKAEIILIFLFSLYTTYLITRRELPSNLQVALVALLGLSPYFWDLKDQVVSDLPFLGLAYLSIYFIQQAYRKSPAGMAKLGYILLISFIIYFSYATRSVGLVLVPSLLLYDLIRHKRPTLFAISIAVITCTLIILQSVLLRSDRGYIAQFGAEDPNFLMNWLQLTINKAPDYPKSLTVLWDNGYYKNARLALTSIISVLALIGYAARLLKRISLLEIFTFLYFALIIIAPMHGGVRYLIPVIPLYVFYALHGVTTLFRKQRWQRYAFATLVVVILACYAGKYTKVNYGSIAVGIGSSETTEFFDYIRTNTEENDVIIFTKPRALALFTGRRSSFYPSHVQAYSDWWEYFQKIRANYVVIGPNGVEEYEQSQLTKFAKVYKDSLEEVYSNSGFKVYRIKEFPSLVTTSHTRTEK